MARLVFCLNGPNQLNGPNVWLTRHLPLLRELGASPEVLYLTYRPAECCATRLGFERAGFPVHPVVLRSFTDESVEAILEVVGARKPDVFVPNYSVPAYFACRYLREAGVATVGTVHSDDPYYRDIVDLFVAGAPEWALSGVVAVSDYLASSVEQVSAGRVPVMLAPYGVPVPETAACHRGDSLRIVYCGRIVERQKRVTRVARRLCAAAARLPSMHAVLYGDGPEVPLVADIIANGNCGGRVSLGGVLSEEEVIPRLLDAQVFVLLSDFEGLSIALMEAMACGLVPIVSQMRSGVADLIVDGHNGFVIDGDNEDAFCAAVGRLIDDPERWRRMSCAARASVVGRGLTSASCAHAWLEFCEQLLRGSPSQRDDAMFLSPGPGWWRQLPRRPRRVDGIKRADRRSILGRLAGLAASGRPTFLWGAGSGGRSFLKAMGRTLPLAGVVDSDPARHSGGIDGYRIFPPEILTRDLKTGPRPFVIVTSQFLQEIAPKLEALGFLEYDDYAAVNLGRLDEVADEARRILAAKSRA